MLRWWRKQLDIRAFLVFQRLRRFNQTFIVLAALVSGLDIGALSYQEFRSRGEDDASLNHTAEGFLCSSAITAVISALIAGMLLFQFEGLEKASRLELAVAWIPLTLMDVAIVEFLIGITCWYAANNVRWRGALMATQLTALLGLCIALSAFMWLSMREKGGLGEEERKVTAAERRGVDADREEATQGTESWLGEMTAKSQNETNQVQRQEAEAENGSGEGKPRARRPISTKTNVANADAVPSPQGQ
ncbi:uncharacterized protein FMAN_07311 [Fusarium mangiferae]|uniref:Transmembrane protein n=1 Tax=Fusarium mangiferae TaxID=192010 RepID=A0A1L7TA14_FUSMA|nr:uncharacterized protein FMAN_07311 [Fusarium mangiferae]CVK92415.1 uncharacterized protein FMAN_07311 [Fusarium mangiferae]